MQFFGLNLTIKIKEVPVRNEKAYYGSFFGGFHGCFLSVSAFAEGYTVGMVVKNVGNPFMDAAGRGGEEAW